MTFQNVSVPQPIQRSKRRYRKHRVSFQPWSAADRPLTLLYEDEETGMLTADVGKFERWVQALVVPSRGDCYLEGCERGCTGHEG